MKHRLFAYGTLRRSHAAIHHRVVGSAQFLGRGSIAGRLFDLGRYPGVHRAGHDSWRVSGELYELMDSDPESRLLSIDRYEGPEFVRARVLVELEGGDRRLAWAYLLAEAPPMTARPIPSGTYRRRRSHATVR